MKKYHYFLIVLLNVLPIILFVWFGNNIIVRGFIVLYSLCYTFISVVIFLLNHKSYRKWLSIPFGCFLLSFFIGYRTTICEDYHSLMRILILFSFLFGVLNYIVSNKNIYSAITTFLIILIITSGQCLYINNFFGTENSVIIESVLIEKYANKDWFNNHMFSFFEVETEEFGTIMVDAHGDVYDCFSNGDIVLLEVKEGVLGIKCCSIIKKNTGDGTMC